MNAGIKVGEYGAERKKKYCDLLCLVDSDLLSNYSTFFKACEFLRENLGTYWAKHSSKEKCSALCFLCRNCKTSTSCFLLC